MHPNLAPSSDVPEQGWTSTLAAFSSCNLPLCLPAFCGAAEGPSVEDVDEGYVDPEDNSLLAHSIASQHSASSRESHADSSLTAFRGLSKGFRFFFKDVEIF